MSQCGNGCAEMLGLTTRLEPGDIISIGDYVGPGYGILTDPAREAMLLAVRTDVLLLDPVYTSKAMAGLIDHICQGLIAADCTIVFILTGDHPALFAYADELGLEDSLQSGCATELLRLRQRNDEA